MDSYSSNATEDEHKSADEEISPLPAQNSRTETAASNSSPSTWKILVPVGCAGCLLLIILFGAIGGLAWLAISGDDEPVSQRADTPVATATLDVETEETEPEISPDATLTPEDATTPEPPEEDGLPQRMIIDEVLWGYGEYSGSALVRITNPNEDHWARTANAEITLLDDAGNIVDILNHAFIIGPGEEKQIVISYIDLESLNDASSFEVNVSSDYLDDEFPDLQIEVVQFNLNNSGDELLGRAENTGGHAVSFWRVNVAIYNPDGTFIGAASTYPEEIDEGETRTFSVWIGDFLQEYEADELTFDVFTSIEFADALFE